MTDLRLEAITAGYGRTTVLRAVDLLVPTGSVVALLGANGAGKTTLLRVASGLIGPRVGRVLLGGEDVTRAAPSVRAEKGLCLVPEGRGIFRNMTVRDNLILQLPPWEKDKSVEAALDAFPVLKRRLGQVAGQLSGGEQQMLALSRAYLAKPQVVLLDEVSMGLAPVIVDQLFDSLQMLAKGGVGLLVVEQHVHRALEIADTVYLMVHGEITQSSTADTFDQLSLVEGYLG